MNLLFWLFLFALVVAGWLVWVTIRPRLFTRKVKQVRREFASRRPELEKQFFAAASHSGKPRGLAWTQCAFQETLTLARDRANGEIVGLVAVTIGFEAIEGGGMEDVAAVANLRAATAVFTHNGRQWLSQGRAVFNLEPQEVIERYSESLVKINESY